MKKRLLSMLLVLCMVMTMLPSMTYVTNAAGDEFTATSAPDGKNYATLSWQGTAGSKYAITKSDGNSDIYETIPLKYSINVLNVYPDTGNNLKNWMQSNGTGSPTIDGTEYTMTVDEVAISSFNDNPSAYLGTAGGWKYDVIYFGGWDANNNYDISLTACNLLEQFINSGGGVLLGHDTAAFNYTNFKYIASTYLKLQATEANLSETSPDYIPMYGNTEVKVARKGLLTNYPYTLGDVGTVMTVPESHSYHEFASGNVWFSYNGTNSNWDQTKSEMTTYKGKTGTNNFYLTTLNNVAMIQTGHSNGLATIDEQKILTNTLYYLAQTTSQTTFDDHSAQDLTAPGKVSGSVIVSGSSISFTESVDAGNDYSYKLYTVDDVNGIKTDTGKTAQATVKTGLKGYSYVINQSENAIGIDTTVEATSASIDVSTLAVGNYYLHIRAVDNAGNASDESVLAFTIEPAQPAGSVTLNKPVFNNDKSGYSFKSAAINNFTGVNSITFSITKGTTVQSVPTFLTPSSKLESIDGDTRTFTYVFENGITVSQAEEFIRGIVFNYVAGAEISITVDNNTTRLPDGAKITKLAEHYYMFVPTTGNYPWVTAYNNAKSYRYMGMIGYLATITSKEEDNTLTDISKNGAWSGGSRMLKSDGTQIGDDSSYINYTGSYSDQFYWTCGPEAGTVYFTGITSSGTTPDGMYSNWQSGEPNNDLGEDCMQVNYTGAYGTLEPKWNDIYHNGANVVTGYFVEFSNYEGGMENSYASDKTAVGTYNLATDGGVEEAATVTLNAPVYGSGNKSVFSFDNAAITNINTVYSLTIKLDNYTNVLSKPSAPAVSNELSNIAGATNTITYQFENGITQTEAQGFLRGLRFRYGGLNPSSTTNVSVTVDGNKTNLPQGASITEFNGHYYMYVPSDFISWTNAYNKAKSYMYMGLKGYLATITSQEEDKVLTNISTISAWSAGTRYLNDDTSKVMDPDNVSVFSQKGEFYYWACGPEAGTIYYNSILPTSEPGAGYTGYNGAYNNWGANPGQPDAYDNVEVCMQVNWPYDTGAAGQMRWNDLPNDGLPNIDLVKGYFVEFSDYEGGRVEGFTQSANGKSMVPVLVEKGDVFNTVKDSSTYYVDTVLTAFDRNITKITVNGSAFISGSKLAGNTNTTYTIMAMDLEDNTATIMVNMKTIASISEPIKDLTVNNVQMSNKDSILAVKAALMAIDTTDASTEQKTEIDSAVQNCENLYFALFNATATAPNGTNGWYKNGINDITLTAPDGFEISTSTTGTWTSSITVDKADGANKTAIYYLKEISTNDISNAKTLTYNVDTIAPTGTITIKNNAFKEFINKVSFGLFFKNSVDVSISGTDTLSNPVTISYQKVKDGGLYDEGGTWISGSSFSVMANEKFSVYAKITDNAGNTTIINSDGVVVYTDSTQGTMNISFTKTSTTDVTATVNLNGNTIKEIRNGDTVLVNVNDYSVLDGTITFKASYLDGLTVGSYTFVVIYNPMGEGYIDASGNQEPATTILTLDVKAKDMSETGGESPSNVIIYPDSVIYSGNAFNPTVTVKDGTKVLVEDTDYTLGWTDDMMSAGEKTLSITFKGSYTGVVTKKATVINANITDETVKTQSAIYNGNMQTVAIPTGTTVNSQALAVWYSADGSAYNLTSVPGFTAAGTYTVYYELSAPNHNTITGQIAFTINAATDNAISNLALNGWTFGEKANTPTAAAKYGTPVFTYSNSENGVYTPTVPTAAGTYFVKASVDASADYNGCEAKTSFVIAAKAIGDKDIAISDIKDYYLFTGSAITPEPTVTVCGTVLVKDTDYTVNYENNTQIGINSKVKVTLKGNYSGTAERTFEIRYDTKENLPQTSDSGNMPLWIALLFISGGVITTLNVYKGHRKSSAK